MYVNVLKILIFESFMKTGRSVFLKIGILGQNWSRRRFFKMFRKICFFYYFKVYRCEDKPKLDLNKKFEHFIISSLSTMLIRTFIWVPPLNCT